MVGGCESGDGWDWVRRGRRGFEQGSSGRGSEDGGDTWATLGMQGRSIKWNSIDARDTKLTEQPHHV